MTASRLVSPPFTVIHTAAAMAITDSPAIPAARGIALASPRAIVSTAPLQRTHPPHPDTTSRAAGPPGAGEDPTQQSEPPVSNSELFLEAVCGLAPAPGPDPVTVPAGLIGLGGPPAGVRRPESEPGPGAAGRGPD
eukprot:765981-Hanusia_phi.AAC.3